MPFQPINFLQMPVQGNSFARNFTDDLVGSLIKGFQLGQIPSQIRQQQQDQARQQQAQALQQQLVEAQRQKVLLESQGIPEKQQAYIDNLKSQINLRNSQRKSLENKQLLPFGGNQPTGDVGQGFQLAEIERVFGKDSSQAIEARRVLNAGLDRQKGSAIESESSINSKTFRSLPSAEKQRIISTGVALGYNPDEVIKRLTRGESLNDLANEKNIEIGNVTPSYPLSQSATTQMANRKAFAKEISALEENVGNSFSSVGRRIFGFSPTQVIDAISNKNPDEQGKILAARAIQPELAALRIKAAGGNVGITAIKKLQDSALGELNVFKPLVSPEAYSSMNKYIDKWITNASDTFNESMIKSSSLGNKSNTKKTEENDEEVIPTKGPDGKWRIK